MSFVPEPQGWVSFYSGQRSTRCLEGSGQVCNMEQMPFVSGISVATDNER